MKTTRQTLEEARSLEADHNWTAEKILTVLEANNGKKITRRILPKIAAILGQEVILEWTANNSLLYIETMNYRRSRDACGPGAVKILIPTGFNQSSLPEINVEEIRERNTCYLSAALERNEARTNLLNSDYPEQVDAAGQAYRDAKAVLESLTSYPNPDRFRLQKLQGLH